MMDNSKIIRYSKPNGFCIEVNRHGATSDFYFREMKYMSSMDFQMDVTAEERNELEEEFVKMACDAYESILHSKIVRANDT